VAIRTDIADVEISLTGLKVSGDVSSTDSKCDDLGAAPSRDGEAAEFIGAGDSVVELSKVRNFRTRSGPSRRVPPVIAFENFIVAVANDNRVRV